MDKPTPKEELRIQPDRGLPATWLNIWVESDGAREWIQQEAPAYGELITSGRSSDYFELCVRPTYSINEVSDYLMSYITGGEGAGDET